MSEVERKLAAELDGWPCQVRPWLLQRAIREEEKREWRIGLVVESFSLQKEERVYKTPSCRGARLALIAIVRPYPSVGSFRPFSGSFAALRGSFCCPFWAVFRRFSWWFVSGSVWVRSCTRRDLQQQRVFGRRWPWEFFPSRADLDYPPNDLGIDLSKKLLLRSPFRNRMAFIAMDDLQDLDL
uniref:Uncharacterized protein n=1 Tax=Fagus sylvatica TaxID=28930 RepID=A0A2N9GN94_FAGSY